MLLKFKSVAKLKTLAKILNFNNVKPYIIIIIYAILFQLFCACLRDEKPKYCGNLKRE